MPTTMGNGMLLPTAVFLFCVAFTIGLSSLIATNSIEPGEPNESLISTVTQNNSTD